jgi:type IV pilus assembly protein PilW
MIQRRGCFAVAGGVGEPALLVAGFSIIELMVALAIGSVLLLALATLFINTSAARTEIDKSSRQIESGRFAMQVLSDDIRHAGYYGPLINAPTNTGGLTALPDPCSSSLAVVQNSAFLPLQGYAGAASAGALGLNCISSAAGYKANTSVLVVRRIDTSIATAATAPTTGHFNIQASGCAGDPAAYVLDKDATGPFTLHSNGAPGCTPITSAPPATLAPYYVRIYFISTCSNTDCSASGADSVPTLKRIDIFPDTVSPSLAITPIVDGVENLQFDYGIDTTAAPGDGVPDVYTNTTGHAATTPQNITEWQNVMTVRVYLLARNLEASSGFTDQKTYQLGPVSYNSTDAYRRHAYNELVRLYNPSGRRE